MGNPATQFLRSASHWPPALQRLVWVVAAVALAVVPHIPHVKIWVLLLGASAAALRLVIEFRHWRMPPKWVRSSLAFADGFLFVALAMGFLRSLPVIGISVPQRNAH